jgi:branched-subunit amino acid transport protein
MKRRNARMPEFVQDYFIYLAIMAGVTYLVRMLPFVLVRKKIKNRFVKSFLYYIPYSVLTVMTIPAIFFSTGSLASAIAGAAVAVILSYFNKSLLTVAASASATVLLTEIICGAVLL